MENPIQCTQYELIYDLYFHTFSATLVGQTPRIDECRGM